MYGAEESVSIGAHEPEPAGAISKRTDSTPAPVSSALAVRVTAERRFAPGSSSETVGAVASARTTCADA